MLKYFLYRFGQILVGCFPLKVAYVIADILSTIKYYLSPRDRHFVRENLRVIFSNIPYGEDQSLEQTAKTVFKNFGRYLVEFFRLGTDMKATFLDGHFRVENREVIDQALAQGRGAILLTAHIGNWELGGFVMGKLGYPIIAIALPHKERKVNEMFDRQRQVAGMTIVPVQTSIRPCLKALKENKLVAMLADRDFSASGIAMRFFEKPTMIPKGAAIFAYRTGAAVIPSFLKREQDNTFCLKLGEPLKYPENYSAMPEDDFIQSIAAQQVDVLEKEIAQDPAQWLIFRQFWFDHKHGPERITAT